MARNSRKQDGRYNPNAPDYDAVHRKSFLDRMLFAGVGGGLGTAPEWWRIEGEMAQLRAARAERLAARKAQREAAIASGSRKWVCYGAGRPLFVRANTKSEARARFKKMMPFVGLLPAFIKVLAA